MPQGTVLGPLCFLLLINEIADDQDDRWKYVNDLTVAEVLSKRMKSQASTILHDIADQASSQNMIVNPDKSAVVTFSFLKTAPAFHLPFDSKLHTKEITLLGVVLS